MDPYIGRTLMNSIGRIGEAAGNALQRRLNQKRIGQLLEQRASMPQYIRPEGFVGPGRPDEAGREAFGTTPAPLGHQLNANLVSQMATIDPEATNLMLKIDEMNQPNYRVAQGPEGSYDILGQPNQWTPPARTGGKGVPYYSLSFDKDPEGYPLAVIGSAEGGVKQVVKLRDASDAVSLRQYLTRFNQFQGKKARLEGELSAAEAAVKSKYPMLQLEDVYLDPSQAPRAIKREWQKPTSLDMPGTQPKAWDLPSLEPDPLIKQWREARDAYEALMTEFSPEFQIEHTPYATKARQAQRERQLYKRDIAPSVRMGGMPEKGQWGGLEDAEIY